MPNQSPHSSGWLPRPPWFHTLSAGILVPEYKPRTMSCPQYPGAGWSFTSWVQERVGDNSDNCWGGTLTREAALSTNSCLEEAWNFRCDGEGKPKFEENLAYCQHPSGDWPHPQDLCMYLISSRQWTRKGTCARKYCRSDTFSWPQLFRAAL